MEVPAEATLHLNCFPDENKAREIVKSSGLTLTELGGGRVLLRGYYSRLKAASLRLKELLETPTKPTHHFSWSDEMAPSDPDSRRPGRSTLNRSKSLPRQRSPRSPLSPSLFSHSHSHSVGRQNSTKVQNSFRTAFESFPIEADVYKYANQVKNEEIQNILRKYSVQLHPEENCDSFTVTLKGSDSNKAAFNLQRLFADLSDSLRTQDVTMKELSRDGVTLLKSIRKKGNIYDSVLVCEKKGSLHLVGPSQESYALKQKLLNGQRRASFGWKKHTILSKSRKHSVGDDSPVGGAVGGVPGITHDMSGQHGPAGFSRSGSKRKKDKPDRTQKDTETPNHSKSSIANFFSALFSRKSKKAKNKKDEK